MKTYRESTYKIITEISSSLDTIKNLPTETLQAKNKEIKELISYYIGLTKDVEDRRTKIYITSLQVLALSLASLLFVIDKKEKLLTSNFGSVALYTVGSVAICFIVGALCCGILYHLQSKFIYPFLKQAEYSNKWKWFYYGNKHIQKLNTKIFCLDSTKEEMIYLQGLSDFIELYSTETMEQEIESNIIQLYLLQVHNYYKNKFYLQLTRIWNFIYISIPVIFVVTASIHLLAN